MPAEGERGSAPTVEMHAYRRTFTARHQNVRIEMTLTYEAPLDTAEELPGPAEYAVGSHESYATNLIQTLPRQRVAPLRRRAR